MRFKELVTININAAEMAIIANELKLDKKVAENLTRAQRWCRSTLASLENLEDLEGGCLMCSKFGMSSNALINQEFKMHSKLKMLTI